MPKTQDTLALLPSDLACEELRTELLSLADEARDKAVDSALSGRTEHGSIYLAAADWIEKKIGGRP